MDVGDAAEPGDDAGQQHDRQVGLVLPDAVVVQRDQLVLGRRQPHDPVPVHTAAAVDIAARQYERELGPEFVRGRLGPGAMPDRPPRPRSVPS